MFIFGILLGILIGAMVGIVIMALMISVKDKEATLDNLDNYLFESSEEIAPDIKKNE